MPATTLVWFRHDLRLDDNPALAAAAARGAVVPVFIWAPNEEAPWEPGAASRWWLHQSLEKLAALPEETKIYCGHEYTLSNGKFAVTVDPDNSALQARMAEVAALRAADRFTLPTTVAAERATNPFLRAGETGVKLAMGLPGADADVVFAEMRARKNRFAA